MRFHRWGESRLSAIVSAAVSVLAIITGLLVVGGTPAGAAPGCKDASPPA
jgi:hypothetical protein